MTGVITDFNQSAECLFGSQGDYFETPSAPSEACIAYDQNNLYLGYFEPDALSNSGDYDWSVYIGGAAASTASVDNFPTTGYSFGTALPTNFNASYHFFWRDSGVLTELNGWNGTKWVNTGVVPTVVYNGGTSHFVEASIPLAALGNPTDLHFLGGLGVDPVAFPGDQWACDGTFPFNYPNGGNKPWWQQTFGTTNFTDWQTVYLNQGWLPADPTNADKP
jgi:hypothetical protein